MPQDADCFLTSTDEMGLGLDKLKSILHRHGYQQLSHSDLGPTFGTENSKDQQQIAAPFLSRSKFLVVYITNQTHGSALTKWEVEYARQFDLRIIGVWSLNYQTCNVPPVLKMLADAVVRFDEESILQAMEGSNIFECPDGTPWDSIDIERREC